MTLTFSIDSSVGSFGHQFIVGLEGSKLTDTEKLDLADLKPLGIQLRRRNFGIRGSYAEWIEDLKSLIADAREAIGREKIVVAIEEDGERYHATPEPLTNFGDPLRWGERAADVGAALSEELISLGVNLYLGPIADVKWRLPRHLPGQLAIGETADDATLAACAVSKTMLNAGLLVAPKHFPGQGHAQQAPGFMAPRIELSPEEVTQGDMRPFGALIDIGAPAIMGSPYVFAAIDPDAPAAVSPKIVRAILREKMLFEGVVITNELDGDEITRTLTDSDIIRNALSATCDILRVSSTERAILFAQAFFDALLVRIVSEESLAKSFARIDSLYGRLLSTAPVTLDELVLAQHKDLVSSLGV